MLSKLPSFERLTGVFEKYSDIQAVYLFGSVASGQMHRESDLDVEQIYYAY